MKRDPKQTGVGDLMNTPKSTMDYVRHIRAVICLRGWGVPQKRAFFRGYNITEEMFSEHLSLDKLRAMYDEARTTTDPTKRRKKEVANG